MNSSPNRERVLKGFDDDSHINRVSDGRMSAPIEKRQNEVGPYGGRHKCKRKPKGQHAYRLGMVR